MPLALGIAMFRFGRLALHVSLLQLLQPTVEGIKSPDPALCAEAVAIGTADLVSIVYDVFNAWADCTMPTVYLGKEELACTSDILALLDDAADMGSRIADATLVCGQVDSTCAASVLVGLSKASEGSQAIVAAANDCSYDPFLCTVDIAAAISKYDQSTVGFLNAVAFCNAPFVDPLNKKDLFDFRNPGSLESAKRAIKAKPEFGDGGYYEQLGKTPSKYFE
eukprot:CAMPEP_0183409580 /NCGR_PEP_ID=MMETSP0370-20130417/18934_1 /TAXON_ID=268820 /ORGANISM="Peridinium aciculiferum, Strain PAER-2" /LENGTH=221 /DNA_ID=CAMNT_0025592289 /DNA_START=27 /DNA_END=692 /DNA_ORIENTATION=-